MASVHGMLHGVRAREERVPNGWLPPRDLSWEHCDLQSLFKSRLRAVQNAGADGCHRHGRASGHCCSPRSPLVPTGARSGGPWSGSPLVAGPRLGSRSAMHGRKEPTLTGSSEFPGRDKRGQLSLHEGGRERTTQPGVRPQEVAGARAHGDTNGNTSISVWKCVIFKTFLAKRNALRAELGP